MVTYGTAACALHLLGLFRVVVSASGSPNGGWIVHYALPPLVPGIIMAALGLAAWPRRRLSAKRVAYVTLLVPLLVVLARNSDAWLHPLTFWEALRDRWTHPYVVEAIFLVQRDLAYAALCTGAAGLIALIGDRRDQPVVIDRAGSPTMD
jgi:hypothetical protein